ncbi:MAG: ABC transporter permease [Nitrospirae bacterium]|nr:ABC transporter permease [Magnetococcales bacterium]HAT50875.1 hypothetical protein [Alphaproteobacteria bacterium]
MPNSNAITLGRQNYWGTILAIAKVTLLEGVRTRLPGLVLVLLGVSVTLALFAGSLAVMEVREIQAAVLGLFLRLGGVLVMVLFVLTAQVREFHDKGVDLVLSLPIPRAGYFFGRLLGFSIIALMVAIVFAGTTLFFAPVFQGMLWGVSLFFELLLVTTLSLLCLLTFNQVPAAFSMVMAVYLLARTVAILQWVGEGPIMPKGVITVWLMNRFIDGLAFVLPALDRFTRSDWLVYGDGGWGDLLFVMVQGSIYWALLSAAALIDLYRKNF